MRRGIVLLKMKMAILAVAVIVFSGSAIAQEAPRPAQIDRLSVLVLVRSTLLALDHANKTGNYTVLRDLGAPAFQSNTAAQLADIFASFRRDNLDLASVAAFEPQLTLLPQIEPNGMLHMSGFFPSLPKQIIFELLFAPVNGQWRLFGIAVNLGAAVPASPTGPAAPAVQPSNNPAQTKPLRSEPRPPAKPAN